MKFDSILACKPEHSQLLIRELEGSLNLRGEALDKGYVSVDGRLDYHQMPCYASWGLITVSPRAADSSSHLPGLMPRGLHPARDYTVRTSSGNYGGLRLWHSGAGRMRASDDSPSRAGMKLEEAFHVLGRAPEPNSYVADLGAAPGGWSQALARRGAYVTAVDRGPLKGDAASNRRITHLRDDASKFAPERGERFDWMVCDIIDYPSRSYDILVRWLERRWMVHFVVTFKTGRADPIEWLRRLRNPQGPVMRHCSELICQHLWHNRDEFTVIGTTRM